MDERDWAASQTDGCSQLGRHTAASKHPARPVFFARWGRQRNLRKCESFSVIVASWALTSSNIEVQRRPQEEVSKT